MLQNLANSWPNKFGNGLSTAIWILRVHMATSRSNVRSENIAGVCVIVHACAWFEIMSTSSFKDDAIHLWSFFYFSKKVPEIVKVVIDKVI